MLFFFHSNMGEAGDRQALTETSKQMERVTKGKEMEPKRGFERLPWWSSGWDVAFQCRACGFNPWSES